MTIKYGASTVHAG